MRFNHRSSAQLRPIQITRQFTKHAEGSVLIAYGDTKIICTATFQDNVPPFLKGKKTGWLTAEYGMLPRATHERVKREAAIGKQTGRTQEIQRLISRSLRACLDLSVLEENTILVDCDVIQADGGTRTASITGACVAVHDLLQHIVSQKIIKRNPWRCLIAAISVGMHQGQALLDLDYQEDSQAETDMNLVMTERGDFIEIQGTAEHTPFSTAQLQAMLELGRQGINALLEHQRAAIQKK